MRELAEDEDSGSKDGGRDGLKGARGGDGDRGGDGGDGAQVSEFAFRVSVSGFPGRNVESRSVEFESAVSEV